MTGGVASQGSACNPPAAEDDPPAVSKPAYDPPREGPMSKIGKPQRTIEIEPIEEPAPPSRSRCPSPSRRLWALADQEMTRV